MKAAHKDDTSDRVKNSIGDIRGSFRVGNVRRCTDHDMDGGDNIPQMEADYPAVTTGKKIDGGKTRERDLRDEEKGFL